MLLSVAAMTLIFAITTALARTTIRSALLGQVMYESDLDACEADPALWGNPAGFPRMFAYDLQGVSAHPQAPPLEPRLLEAATASAETVVLEDDVDLVVAVAQVRPDGPCAVLRVESWQINYRVLQRFLAILAVSTLIGMTVSGSATLGLVVRPLRKRVEKLSEAAFGVGREDFEPPESGRDALGHIGQVLTESHERIVETREALEARNQALEDHLAGIAHDLRTPLSSMQLALESLAGEADGGLQQEARRALADVVYLASLVDNLHQGTRLRHDVDVDSATVDLTELVQRLERRFTIVGRHAEVAVAANTPDTPVRTRCRPALAERAIANLVQNAVEHNPGSGNVALMLEVQDDTFVLSVLDDGPGLPDGVLASLDEATFLLDAARRRGPGLGMLITAEVARRAGWTLTYEPLEPSGLRARLTGPLAD